MGALQHQRTQAPSPGTVFDELLGTRRSIRRYSKLPVSRELVDSLLQAAVTAPSAHNRQPWRFLVLENNKDKQTLARAITDVRGHVLHGHFEEEERVHRAGFE